MVTQELSGRLYVLQLDGPVCTNFHLLLGELEHKLDRHALAYARRLEWDLRDRR